MLVKNPIEIVNSIDDLFNNNTAKVLYLCIFSQNHSERCYDKNVSFFHQRINNATIEIERQFSAVGIQNLEFHSFISIMALHDLKYSWADNEYWDDFYGYISGQKSLKVIDKFKGEEYYLTAVIAKQEKVELWKDIRKLREF